MLRTPSTRSTPATIAAGRPIGPLFSRRTATGFRDGVYAVAAEFTGPGVSHTYGRGPWSRAVGGSVTGRGTTRDHPPTSRLPSMVMNRRQRRRELARRRAHATQAGRPRNVLSLGHYSPVKKGHIVPQVFQRSFAIDEQLAVHVDGGSDCRSSHIRDAATRSRFYQRTRRDGTAIDDTEASLAVMESTVRPVLADLLRDAPLTAERKGVLAQFLGLQMVRGPAFFEQHSQHIDALVAGLDASRFARSRCARPRATWPSRASAFKVCTATRPASS
jgi:Protein of unknown function (DUF4238)